MILSALGVLLPLALRAEIYCRQTETLGLYEQCEEVKILGEVGENFRVYSLPKRQVYTVKPTQLRLNRTYEKLERVEKEQVIAVPSQYLWNSSSAGYLSLCQIESELKGDIIQVTCGRFRQEKIQKSKVIVVQALPNRTALKQPQLSGMDSKSKLVLLTPK